jgi:hypothetical protein
MALEERSRSERPPAHARASLNALAAEQDFGRHFVALARDSSRHETWAAYEAVPCDHAERPEANTGPAKDS